MPLSADLKGLVNPFQNALARHLQGACDLDDSAVLDWRS
jgi:hypothetical protein